MGMVTKVEQMWIFNTGAATGSLIKNIIIIINFPTNHKKTELQKHMTEQKQKAATEAARLNELATHDNVKCHLQ